MTKKKDVFYGGTDTGKQRDNNEDAFIAFYSSDHQHVIAAVIDGVGGYEGGEIAAAIAQEVLTEHFKAVQPDLTAQMKEAIYQTNERIYAESLKNPEFDHMACVLTLAVADPANNSFSYAHVGDTRLYLFRDNSLVKVTRDHSFVGFL
ncbi:MAG TPA: protein phosphatase 2C domain-containing protein, partial [Flavisolibacter sp.]|nr:protein phosphatase 2C domain-containing protein [Flavisolibacter sp.]